MVIYIEEFLLFNLVIHTIFIILIKLAFSLKLSGKRFILSCFLCIGFALIYIYYPAYYTYIKYLIGILLVTICFKGSLKHLLFASFYYYSFNFILGGIVNIANITTKFYYEIVALIALALAIIYYSLTLKKIEPLVDLEIHFPKKTIKLKGFVDTGAKIYANLKPVVILASKYFDGNKALGEVSLSLVSGQTKLNYYPCVKIVVKKSNYEKEIDCYVAYCEIPYDAIISYALT